MCSYAFTQLYKVSVKHNRELGYSYSLMTYKVGRNVCLHSTLHTNILIEQHIFFLLFVIVELPAQSFFSGLLLANSMFVTLILTKVEVQILYL